MTSRHLGWTLAFLAGAASATTLSQSPAAPPAPAVAPAPPAGPDMNAFYQIGPDSLAREGVPKGREIPVMIAVFINPGRTPEQPEPTPQEWGDRTTNRPTEYNSLDDKYARVV